MIHALVLATLAGLPPCWDVFDSALRHSASALHPPYVTYSERISITADREPLLMSLAQVDYRDDGIARVSDERFNYIPFITRHTEPGPPELGPYGDGRTMWLPDTTGLPTIAQVRSAGNTTCKIADEETYKSHDTYHLAFAGGKADRPHLKDLWVDVHSGDIWKLIVTGPIVVLNDPDRPFGLAEFQVELGYSGPYLVVNHVVWSYRRYEYSQYVDYFGEYEFTGYSFPASLPASYFDDDTTTAAMK
jgi:hypothetical protein